MKRIFALLFISFIVLSCSNEVRFNTPLFQGAKNYQYWKVDEYLAVFTDSGGLKIVGITNRESITLNLVNVNEGTYGLGPYSQNSAIFEDKNFVTYSTDNNGDGFITIEEFNSENLTISGKFQFNSFSEEGELVNFIDGVFFDLPIAVETDGFVGSNSFGAVVNSDIMDVGLVETDILDSILKVTAINNDGTIIEIFMPEDITVGSYTLNSSSQIYANYIFFDGVVTSSQYGTLIIFEHDLQFNKIKASFIFNTGHPYNIEVTSGNFIIYY